MQLIEVFLQHINFLTVSIVALFAFNTYISSTNNSILTII